jgi:hypothetical protein
MNTEYQPLMKSHSIVWLAPKKYLKSTIVLVLASSAPHSSTQPKRDLNVITMHCSRGLAIRDVVKTEEHRSEYCLDGVDIIRGSYTYIKRLN